MGSRGGGTKYVNNSVKPGTMKERVTQLIHCWRDVTKFLAHATLGAIVYAQLLVKLCRRVTTPTASVGHVRSTILAMRYAVVFRVDNGGRLQR